jgi:hypothetical protein
MSIIARFTPDNLTTEKYNEATRRLTEAGLWPQPEMEYHFCFGEEGKLRVTEVWSSREELDAALEQVLPILSGVGIELSTQLEIFDVHNIVTA